MYWIVFALFTCTETITDVFFSWFPFYYEVKIVLVLWLLSPATKGSSILYRKFVHPALCRREQEIDEYIAKAKDQGYHTVLNLGTKGVNYATTVIMQTAIKNLNLPSPEDDVRHTRRQIRGRDVNDSFPDLDFNMSSETVPGVVEIVELDKDAQDDCVAGDHDPDYDPNNDPDAHRHRENVKKRRAAKEKRTRSKSRGRKTRSQTAAAAAAARTGGGGLVQQLRKSYSLSDLSECEPRAVEAAPDEADDVLAEPRLIRRQVTKSTRRSASESNSRAPLYFPEVDVEVRGARPTRDEHDFSHIKSSEDISSGYSSADNSGAQQLSRTGSIGARARARNTRTAITTIKRPTPAEDSEVIIEEMADDDTFDYANMPPLLNLPSPLYLSQTNPPFVYHYIGDQVKIIQVLGNIPMTNNATNDDTKQIKKDINEQIDKSVPNVIEGKREIEVVTENIIEYKEPQCNANSDIQIQDNCNNTHALTNENILNTSLMEEKDSANDFNEGITIINPQDDEVNIKFEARIDDDYLDSTSFDTTSFTENASAESDDEASYGTPDNSPRYRRKSPGIGKYGKRKAPSPPTVKIDLKANPTDIEPNVAKSILMDSENLNDILNSLIDFTEIPSTSKSLQVNPIAEKKKRHKSKSPGRIPKAKISKSDSVSASSGDENQRSAVIERLDDSHSSQNLYSEANVSLMTTTHKYEEPDDSIHLTDLMESEAISKEIIDKSDILKRLIEAKIENHPEYKYVSLHDEEIPTCSKSTEV
ncbi:Receptor expression-enhancing protein 4 [Eumeta japonica]|uniref:Receptor expression-enhancing protein 4 n=1 Tax=Eumeta variegata TaxID=151549 RepID=A0A4C1U854_EUMVA|nr:Receptor expression-enhancing protein 4 [Eumeta japonica]